MPENSRVAVIHRLILLGKSWCTAIFSLLSIFILGLSIDLISQNKKIVKSFIYPIRLYFVYYRPMFRPLLSTAFIFDLVLLDQVTKWAARSFLETPVVITSWFEFKLAFNTGVAFSLPVDHYVVIPLTLVVLFWIWKQIGLSDKRLEVVSYVLVFAGALGNLMDRVWMGKVTDFISIGSFPIFNVADSLITLGIIGLLWCELKGKHTL